MSLKPNETRMDSLANSCASITADNAHQQKILRDVYRAAYAQGFEDAKKDTIAYMEKVL